MNKITPKRSKKFTIIVVASVVLVLAGAGALYAFVLQPSTENKAEETSKIDLSEPSKEAKEAGESTKEQTTDTDGKTDNSSDRAAAPQAPAGLKAESGLRITSAMQSGSQVSVRTLIPVFTSQGTCELTMDGPGNASYNASVAVQATASSSTCAGFDIPTSELTLGSWQVTVALNNEKLSGSDTIDLSVK